MPTPPDWEATATPPCGGRVRVKVAFRLTPGRFASRPRQFGPTTRMLWRRAIRTISRSRSGPSPPSSPSPEDRMTRPRVPAAAASRTASTTRSAGTARTARSTGCPTAARSGWAGTPPTVGGQRVDDDQLAVEPAVADRGQHGRTDAAAVTAYPDDGDAARGEQGGQRARLGGELATVGGRHRAVGGGGVELERGDPVLGGGGDVEPGVVEHAQHHAVVGEHLRGEPAYAASARPLRPGAPAAASPGRGRARGRRPGRRPP